MPKHNKSRTEAIAKFKANALSLLKDAKSPDLELYETRNKQFEALQAAMRTNNFIVFNRYFVALTDHLADAHMLALICDMSRHKDKLDRGMKHKLSISYFENGLGIGRTAQQTSLKRLTKLGLIKCRMLPKSREVWVRKTRIARLADIWQKWRNEETEYNQARDDDDYGDILNDSDWERMPNDDDETQERSLVGTGPISLSNTLGKSLQRRLDDGKLIGDWKAKPDWEPPVVAPWDKNFVKMPRCFYELAGSLADATILAFIVDKLERQHRLGLELFKARKGNVLVTREWLQAVTGISPQTQKLSLRALADKRLIVVEITKRPTKRWVRIHPQLVRAILKRASNELGGSPIKLAKGKEST